jgi:hypothetical protein
MGSHKRNSRIYVTEKTFKEMNKNLGKMGKIVEKGDLDKKKLDKIDEHLDDISEDISDFYY